MAHPDRSVPAYLTWRRPLELFRHVLQHEGAGGIFFRALRHLGYRRMRWLVRPVIEPLESELPPGFEIRFLTTDDAAAYLRFRPGMDADTYLAQLANSHRGYAAWYGDEIASVTWVGTKQVQLRTLDRMLSFEPDEWYLYDSYTTNVFRGLRLQSAILARIRDHAFQAKCRYLLCVVEPHNRSNLNSRQRCGFRMRGLLGRVSIGPRRWHFSYGSRRLDD